MEKTDEQIMSEYQAGKRKGLQVIFLRYKIRILNFCHQLLGNRADAEEASGDVFVALLAGKSAFDPQKKFSTWIYTIARNKCVNQIRKRKKFVSMWFSSSESNHSDYQQWDVPSEDDIPSEELEKKEISIKVRIAIRKLPYEQREAIVLRQYNGFSYDEISEVLDCSLEKVKILIFRSKEQLRIELSSFIKETEK